MHPVDRHSALADPSRRALLDVLRRADGPQDVRTLAIQVGLHPNSVREQLTRLADAGLVRVSSATPAGRGRPGYRYAPAPDSSVEPFRALATTLADSMAGLPDAASRSVEAGERWGRQAARALSPVAPRDAIAAVTRLMAESGFAPEPVQGSPTELTLRACPFLPLDTRSLDVVCAVHLGYLRGALRELGASVDATTIHPFRTPDTCTARLEGRSDA